MTTKLLNRISNLLALSAVLMMVGSAVAFWFLRDDSQVLRFALSSLFFFAAAIAVAGQWILNQSISSLRDEATTAAKFKSAIDNSNDLVAISDTSRRLRYLNKAGRKLVGVSEEEFSKGLPTTSFYTPEGNALMKSEIFPYAVEHGMWSGEFEYVNIQTKELMPILMSIFAIRDPETNEVTGFCAVSRDIRDRKLLQKTLDRFFDASLDMFGIADLSGTFIRLNPAFTEILGWSEAELCSRPATDFIHPDDIKATVEQIERQQKGHSVIAFENRYRTKDGRYRWFQWKSIPDGEYTYGAARDITDEKEILSESAKVSREAIAASEAKSQFLANMSHEIRTPLNGIIGMTTLVEDTTLDEEQRSYIDHIKTSSEALLTIVNDILDFSSVEAGELQLEVVDFNMFELADDTAKSLRWAAQAKALEMTLTVEPAARGMFRGDASRVRQVLANMIGNAVKFTNKGSIAISVGLRESLVGSPQINFTVKDTGIGMSKATQAQLFQAFNQADNSTTRKYGGTGLGLSICKKLAELMGGEIGVDSSSGVGSTFWFTVPLAHAQAPAKIREISVAPVRLRTEAQILVAEDNVTNQRVVVSLLKKMGFKAQAVANGSEVLAILRQKRFDLILMDCQMPEVDGYEATALIRSDASLGAQSIPIIALTADGLNGARERCLAAGMNDYMIKPLQRDELAALLDKWLAKRAA